MLRIHSKVGLFPVFRDKDGFALFDGFDGRLGQRGGVHIPLLGQPRLDRHAAAVAVRHLMHVRLDLFEKSLRLQHFDDALARLEAVEAMESQGLRRHLGVVEKVGIALKQHLGVGVQHIDLLEIMALADLKIVEIVGRGDLDGASTLFGVGIGIRHDGNAAADKRQDDIFPDQRLVALIVRVNGNA